MAGGLSHYLADRISSHASAGTLQGRFTGVPMYAICFLAFGYWTIFSIITFYPEPILCCRKLKCPVLSITTAVDSGFILQGSQVETYCCRTASAGSLRSSFSVF